MDGLALVASAAVAALAVAGAPLFLLHVSALVPLWIVLHKLLGLYDRDANLIHTSTLDEAPHLLLSIVLGGGTMFLVGPPVGLDVSRGHVLVFMAAACAFLPFNRALARAVLRRRAEPERALIVGSGAVGALVARKLRAHPEYGVEVVGFIDVASTANASDTQRQILGDLEQFDAICREFSVERVVFAFANTSHVDMLDAVRTSRLLNLKITLVPRLFEVIGHGVEIDQVEGMTMLGLRGLGRTHSSLLLKRFVDVVTAGAGLALFAPVLLVVAVLIKLDSPGPVFFRQERIGRGNRPFRIWKFRTMVDGADAMKERLRHLSETPAPMFKISDDPRVTRVGRFLRSTSIDELPQLFNVLRGEMSLVGPRPLVPDEDDQVIGWHRSRLDLTPGLTGPWQVLGRSAIPFHEMVKLDYLYVNDWSLWNDLKLIVRTGRVMLARNGC